MDPVEAQGWKEMMPLYTKVYSEYLRLIYYNLEIGNIENIEFTVESKVGRKNIVLNLSTLSEIINTPMIGDHIFLDNQNQLDRYTPYDRFVIDEILTWEI